MTNINTVLPTPGNGTNAAGDTPQEVLFFVTDGMEDEGKPRVMSVMNPAWCTTIKNRGIRIAVLYTTYLPLPTDSWYVNSSGIRHSWERRARSAGLRLLAAALYQGR